VNVLKNANERIAAALSQPDGLAIQIPLDNGQAAGEEIGALQFVDSGTESCAFGLAGREEFLVAILKVLRDLFGNFRFARWREFQRSKSAENLRLPFRHFLPP
jgi:hypothetical protein